MSDRVYGHHIIPKHEWKERFGNLRGVNASDNLVWLTLGQHIQAHQLLFELNSNRYDEIAYQTMSGIIGKEDAVKAAGIQANKGKKHALGYKYTAEQRAALKGNKHSLGVKRTPEQNAARSKFMLGNKYCVGRKLSKKTDP